MSAGRTCFPAVRTVTIFAADLSQFHRNRYAGEPPGIRAADPLTVPTTRAARGR